MRVQFATEGGVAFFPGLSKPTVIDSADLPEDDGAKLRQLIDSARFFDLPEASRALPKGAADYRQYTITVEDGKRRHTVRLTDPVENPNLQALIDFLRSYRAPGAAPGKPKKDK